MICVFRSVDSFPKMSDLNSTGNNSSMDQPDSDVEDDPGHLLNVWLGELNTLKRVTKFSV